MEQARRWSHNTETFKFIQHINKKFFKTIYKQYCTVENFFILNVIDKSPYTV